jgi:hypothetical protein
MMMVWNGLRIGLAAAFTLGGLDLLSATLFLTGIIWLLLGIGFVAPEVGGYLQPGRVREQEKLRTRW